MTRTRTFSRQRLLQGATIGSALLLAACSRATGGGTGEPEPAVGKGAKAGKFTFVTHWLAGHAMTPFTEEAGRRWRARRPDIEVEFVPASGAGAVPGKFITASASGDPYDAGLFAGYYPRDLYDSGQLLDLSRYTKLAPDVADDKFFKNAMLFCRTRGVTFGLPAYGPEGPVIVVSSGTLQESGYDPQGKNVQTWDDLARIADRLTRRNGQEVTRAGYQMSSLDIIRFAGWTYTTNTPLYNDEQTKASFTGAGGEAALEFLARLHNGLRVTQPITQPNRLGQDKALTGGVAAMVDDLTSAPIRLRATPEFRFGMIPYPKGPGGRSPSSDTVISPVALSRASRNAEQAFEFARFFCGNVGLHALRLHLTQLNSPLLAFYQTNEWRAAVKEQPAQAAVPEIGQIAGAYPYRKYDDQNKGISPLLRGAMLGELGAKNALQQAQPIADRLLGS